MTRDRFARARVAALLWLAGAAGAVAQTMPSTPPLPPLPGAVAAAPGPDWPPYEAQLERLAETIGTLTVLRDLCGDGDAADWRARMAALLDAEAESPPRRDRLAGAFNRGFRGYGASYHLCTPSAKLVIARSLVAADRLTRDLAARYGGS